MNKIIMVARRYLNNWGISNMKKIIFLKITGTDFIIFFTFLTHPKHLLKRLNAFFYLKSLAINYLLKISVFDVPYCQKSTFFDDAIL